MNCWDSNMIKYALILPLIVASFLLGYFASTSQREQVYAIAILTAVFVTAVVYLVFVKHQKSSAKKQTKRIVTITLAAVVLFSALTGAPLVKLAVANPVPVYLLTMPEEQINYTICHINGSLWAKVDGTYPLNKVDVECQDGIDRTGFTFSGESLSMVYPMPPGTTDISLKLDGAELEWGNYTETVPEAVHYTAVGDWSMISCIVDPVLDQFMLKIHYEHPIMMINGSSTFLYDLNISPYLSSSNNSSTAHFNIKFETGITDLQINTISTDGTLKPVEYTATKDNNAETVSLQVVSEYSKLLPGDLLITFAESKEQENAANTGKSETSTTGLPMEQVYTIVALVAVAAAIWGYMFLRPKKRSKDEPTGDKL